MDTIVSIPDKILLTPTAEQVVDIAIDTSTSTLTFTTNTNVDITKAIAHETDLSPERQTEKTIK